MSKQNRVGRLSVGFINHRAFHAIFMAGIAGLGVHAASAASVWQGGGTAAVPTSGNWSLGSNWSSPPAAGPTTELDFGGGSISYVSTDDITANSGAFVLNFLSLNSTGGSIAASGSNSLSFAGTAPAVQQSAGGTFAISAPVTSSSGLALKAVNGGEIDFSGAVSGGPIAITNTSGTGNAIMSFSGANSFNGLTVNANTTAIAALSANSTTLGSGTVVLNGGTLALRGRQSTGTMAAQQTIAVSGFNDDIIHENAANSSVTSYTPGTASGPIDGGDYFYENGYNGYNTNGVPASNASFQSTSNSAVKFQLGAYNANNALMIRDDTTLAPATLTLNTPVAFQNLNLLYTGSIPSGATITVSLNFATGQPTTFTFAPPDWYSFTSGATARIAGMTNAGGNANDPNHGMLNEYDYTLAADDQSRVIDSISFTPSVPFSFGASFDVMAISGSAFSMGSLSSQSYANNISVTANSNINVSGSLDATMGHASLGATLTVASDDVTSSAYDLNLGATTLTGSAGVDVKASAGGGAGSVNLGALGDDGTAHTLTINPTGSGTVNLNADSSGLSAGTAVNIVHGTLSSNSAAALGTQAQVSTNSGATFNITASQQISSLSGSGGSVALGTNVLTVGNIADNLSSTYGGVISGAGSILKTGSGTLTLTGANTMSGVNTNSNGEQIVAGVLVNQGAMVVGGPTTGSAGPLGINPVIVNSDTTFVPGATAGLYLDNTPGRMLPNTIFISSGNTGTSVLGGLNTTGTTTFGGNITLGTGTTGDYGHALTVGASGNGAVDFTGNILANSGVNGVNASPIIVNNLSGSGSAIVKFTGRNTFAGGATVNANVTLAAGLSTSLTTLGTGAVQLAGGTLALQGQLASGSQEIVGLSGGFNQQLIAPASAGNAGPGVTTAAVDGGSNVFYQAGYHHTDDPTDTGGYAYGLNPSGLYSSISNPGVQFQLQPYTGPTALQLQGATNSGTFTLTNPGQFQTIDILSDTGASASTVTVTFSFDGGASTETKTFHTQNWYYGSQPGLAIGGNNGNASTDGSNGRIGSAIRQPQIGTNGDSNYPSAMYEDDITLDAGDQSKTLDSITFSNDGTLANIFAISGATNAGSTPVSTQTYANNITVSADSSIDVSGSLNANVGNLMLNGGSTLSVTSSDTTSSPYTLTVGNISQSAGAQTMGFNVSNSTGGGAGNLVLGAYNDNGVVQTIMKSGSGALTFSQDAASMVNGTIINVTGGKLNSNSGQALGQLTVVNLSAGTTLNIGADQTLGALNDDANPTINGSTVALNGHTLQIGNITDAVSSYSGVISDGTGTTGTGGITKAGAQTLTLLGASTYTGTTDVVVGTFVLSGSLATQSLTVESGAIANINGALTGTPAITAGGTLNFGAGAGGILVRKLGALNVSGAVNVAPVSAGNHANRSVIVTSALTNTGIIDISNNDMILQNTTAAALVPQLQQGFNAAGGYWNGTSGIVSTAAAADTRFLTTLGYRQSAGGTFDTVATTTSDTLVKYTYYGDANLDSVVNGADYQQIDMGFGSGGTDWSSGDFNYDGIVNGSDFALIDNTFNQILASGASPLAIVGGAADNIAVPAGVVAAAVPEPTTLAILGIGAMSLLTGRRRRLI